MKSIIKEPLLHFVLIGIAIFFYYSWIASDDESEESYDILIDESDINRLKTAYQLSWSAPPDSMTLERLLEEDIKSEIFSREAKRLGLHHNDEIIRRRLVQKYDFLISDVTEGSQPDAEELDQYYQENIQKYKSPAKYTFYQFYTKEFPDDNMSQSILLSLLDDPNPAEALEKIEHLDAFHINSRVTNQSLKDLELKFGQSFSNEMKKHSNPGWINHAIRSGFGYHFVYLIEYKESQVLPLKEVRNKVIEAWRSDQGTNFKAQLYESLRNRYKIRKKAE